MSSSPAQDSFGALSPPSTSNMDANEALGSPRVLSTRRVTGTPSSKRSRKRTRSGECQELANHKKCPEWFCQRAAFSGQNSIHKLMRREASACGNLGFSRHASAERFSCMNVKQEFDTYDAKTQNALRVSILKKRTRVVEIVAAKGLIFALAHSGVCAAFSRETNKRICYLNTVDDEVIRSLFYNKNNNSLITVSVYAFDNYSSLKCRSTPLEYIRRGKANEGFPLFESESLKWPGFVEFDDVNGKVLTYNAQDHIYKVFDLKNYNILYSISDKDVQEIKISPGIMLLISEYYGKDYVPLKILSVETGEVLKTFSHKLSSGKGVDFIEQFNEKLLVKQEKENLQIVDVCNGGTTEVSSTDFMTPNAFIFLYENQLFLTFRHRKVEVWNFRGELVTSFEDHLLWHPDCNTNNIYITSEQDLIVSYCKPSRHRHQAIALGSPGGPSPPASPEIPRSPAGVMLDSPGASGSGSSTGSINISNILTGKCLAKLNYSSGSPSRSGGGQDRKLKAALEDVTALFYDEERNEIYTGTKRGLVHVWSN